MRLAKVVQADYPLCPFCQHSMARVCTLALADGHSWTLCSACFRIAMVLDRMAAVGILVRE